MRTRDRNRDRDEQQRTSETPAAPAVPGGESDGDAVRRRARRLLDLGDEAISQALSQNSERFLRQNRQQGGQ